ncbi:MAG TPA: signal recognition particle-docking protein FtsY [Methylomusa anaerophila]|uniref:Signal recognition particle receptor FtsY n=1 Tax=Methylomusa anaerophila TaxID=1930071 RepID=A0A348AQ74_9FIRM|nr:signal recognition particle-docking protein FtsY [Methylomusa anaerophila]BBB93222.1 signal recognition particle receptor FtsY [Methylomusa anaerophila]HML86946.1 signal recognition particle-docking protein FtsY [Methylomusa anaerophila]
MGFFDKLKAGLEKTRKNFTEKIEQLVVGYAKIDDELLDDLEAVLLSADVGVPTTSVLLNDIRKGIKGKEINSPDDLRPFLRTKISDMLQNGSGVLTLTEQPPTVILVVGVNGVGKTTTIGKLANYYRQEGHNVIVAAADTFRAAAIDQLEIWGNRVGVDVIKHSEGSDPAAVAFDAVQAAKARKADVLIIDTAGRLHTKTNLMEELKKISRVANREIPGAPHETLLVLDATTGQNAISQAKFFSDTVFVSGVVLTKLDGTAKGGVIVAIGNELGIPVKWVGVGEGVNDLRPFAAAEFAAALFADK